MVSIVDLDGGEACAISDSGGDAAIMQLVLKMMELTDVSVMKVTMEMDSSVPVEVGKMNANGYMDRNVEPTLDVSQGVMDNLDVNAMMDTLVTDTSAELDVVPDMAEDALKMHHAEKHLTTCTNALVTRDSLEMDYIVPREHVCLNAMECTGEDAVSMQHAKPLRARKLAFAILTTRVMDSIVHVVNGSPVAIDILDVVVVDMLAVRCQVENPNAVASLATLEMALIVMILIPWYGRSLRSWTCAICTTIRDAQKMLTALCTRVATGVDAKQDTLVMGCIVQLEHLQINVMVIMEGYVTKMLLALMMMVVKCVGVMKDTLEMDFIA